VTNWELAARPGRRRHPRGTARPIGGYDVHPIYRSIAANMMRTGTHPPVSEERTPCYDSGDFRTLEREVEWLREHSVTRGRDLEYVKAAAREFCAGCPLIQECREWARSDGGYVGVAGGEVFLLAERLHSRAREAERVRPPRTPEERQRSREREARRMQDPALGERRRILKLESAKRRRREKREAQEREQ
jgi:hypothetical protein